jgi:hypothetical protein
VSVVVSVDFDGDGDVNDIVKVNVDVYAHRGLRGP